jgi:hypothetical protein
VLSFALLVCFACTPSAMLACAVICVPGMMSPAAMANLAPAVEASGHEHMHHAMPARAGAASARAASHHDSPHHPEAVAQATIVAPSADAIGPGCCTHARESAGATTRASRADGVAIPAPAACPPIVTPGPARAPQSGRATLIVNSLTPLPTHAPLVLRI